MWRNRDLEPVVATFCAAAVLALSAEPPEHVHAAGADEPETVVHRHLDDGSHHAFDPSLEHPNDHESAWFLDPVFTKAPKYTVDRPQVEATAGLAEPGGEFEGHVDAPDPHPNRGAPHHPDIPRGPPLSTHPAR